MKLNAKSLLSIIGLSLGLISSQAYAKHKKPIEIKAVVMAAFEIGQDEGDTAGEFQNWVEKFPLPEKIQAKDNVHGIYRYDPKTHVLGVVIGEGHINAAQSVTALVLDPRFDLSHAYFILAGIAGGDPYRTTLGTVAWAHYVVNGGTSHMIDAREMPKNWKDMFIPVQSSSPYPKPRPPAHTHEADMVWELNPKLVQWAYEKTKDIKLDMPKTLQKKALAYRSYNKDILKPQVVIGDTMSSDMFWNGQLMNAWAERWVRYWTDNRGVFMTTAMEDSAVMQSLFQEVKAGRVDKDRVLVLRSVSNFDMPHQGGIPISEFQGGEQGLIGLKNATTNVYLVAKVLLEAILKL